MVMKETAYTETSMHECCEKSETAVLNKDVLEFVTNWIDRADLSSSVD